MSRDDKLMSLSENNSDSHTSSRQPVSLQDPNTTTPQSDQATSGNDTSIPTILQNSEESVFEEQTHVRETESHSTRYASRSLLSSVLQERVQGAVTFIGEAVQNVLDFDLLGQELLRVAQLLAEFNQGRFGESIGTTLSERGRVLVVDENLLDDDVESIRQTIDWGVSVARRMLELVSSVARNDKRARPSLYISCAGIDRANGYLSSLELAVEARSFTIVRDGTPLRSDSTRDPPISLFTKCLSAQTILCIVNWEATQEGWPIAELFCAMAKQQVDNNTVFLLDAFPGENWLEVNSAQLKENRRTPSVWLQDIQHLFPTNLSAKCIPFSEATVQEHLCEVAREVSKLYPSPLTISSFPSTKGAIIASVTIFTLITVVVAGVCGSGNCQAPPASAESREADAIVSLLNDLSLEEIPLVYPLLQDPSPGELAMAWLIDVDPLQVQVSDEAHLVQRFVLAMLHFLWVDSIGSRGWLSAEHECDWGNGIECSLPSFALTSLQIDQAKLYGNVPRNIGLLTELTRLDFSSNSLNGQIPTELGLLRNLSVLDLHSNNMTGTLPTEMALMTSLTEVNLFSNDFIGQNPLCNMNATTITTMFADCNEVECSCCSRCCPASGAGATVGCRDSSSPGTTIEMTRSPTTRPTQQPSQKPTPRPSPKPTPRPTGRRLTDWQGPFPNNNDSRVASS